MTTVRHSGKTLTKFGCHLVLLGSARFCGVRSTFAQDSASVSSESVEEECRTLRNPERTQENPVEPRRTRS